MHKRKICLITASEITVKVFLMKHLKALCNAYDVSVVVNANHVNFFDKTGLHIQILPVKIIRNISPWQDILALFQLLKIFRYEKFDLIHSVTPKAGILAMVAGKIAGVPIRIHIFTGQVWVTCKGIKKLLLRYMDKILSASATHILADSFSQRSFLITENIVHANKITVLANGSISGIDRERFKPDPNKRVEIREKLNIKNSDVVFLFVGRLKKDKGVLDIAAAFGLAFSQINNVHLLFVGPDEEDLRDYIKATIQHPGKVQFIPFTDTPEHYMAAADVLCLPSYREGFGSVIIEAAACGLPAIGSRIYGITDAIDEGKTGMTFEVGNVKELSELLYKFYSSQKLREEMGHNAQMRAEAMFSAERVTEAWLEYYRTV